MKDFKDLQTTVEQTIKNPVSIVVANPTDKAVIESIEYFLERNLVKALLVGNEGKIKSLIDEKFLEKVEIFNISDDVEIAKKSVELVRNNQADVIMKGHIQTRDLLKEVVNKETGIRNQKVLSHVALLEIPAYHKLLFLTDAGMVLTPDYDTKVDILKNTVNLMTDLGYKEIKVGCLDASENINPKIQSNTDALELKKLSNTDGFENCYIEGPISLDLSVSKEIAEEKEYNSPVAGDIDVALVPDIVCGNVFSKGLTVFANAKMAGLILGAKVPIVLTSRASGSDEKINSIYLALLQKIGKE